MLHSNSPFVIEWPAGQRPEPAAHSIPDLICLSHLRWGFVFQRPQHLMTRFARERRVFFVEEPVVAEGGPRLVMSADPSGVWVATPHLPSTLTASAGQEWQQRFLTALIGEAGCDPYVLWYWTPMALPFSRTLEPLAVVFDCMDELSAFAFAPPELIALESDLLARADLVFTGGRALYQAKRHRHPHVHLFPSSVDAAHFARARSASADPPDQARLPLPRLGYFGVIDERMDLDLVTGVADARPQWQFVFIGPVVKIDAGQLPVRSNLHFLGQRPYAALPDYLAGWDVALLPFAHNAATRFISPTKTPEYLAAGRPVVSTSLTDIVRPYGELGLVQIADTVDGFVAAIETAMARRTPDWLHRVDAFLAGESWDRTVNGMSALLDRVIESRNAPRAGVRRPTPPSAGGIGDVVARA